MRNYALILAGGTGSRAGGPLPKQFQTIRGLRMLWWSVEAFRAFDPDCRIVVAVHPAFLGRWEELLGEEERALGIRLVKTAGGASRTESVANGLRAIWEMERDKEGDATVFIHDAARPFVTPEIIRRGAETAGEGTGAVPAIPLSDSIRMLAADGSRAADRSAFVAVQTPQVFRLKDIKEAYDALPDENDPSLTDDASVAERHGLRIALYEGDPANRKITNPSDFGA